MRYWMGSLWVILLAGCVKSTELVSPGRVSLNQEARLYVACFFSPQDTVLTAKVGQAVPNSGAGAESVQPEKNARVVISDGVNTLSLSYDSALGYYRAKPTGLFAIRAGTTYQLTVSMDDGRRVQASATVPPAIPIGSIRIDSTTTSQTGGNQSVQYRATINWTSPGGQNYYRGWGQFVQRVTSQSGVETRVSQPNFFVVRENNAGSGPYSTTGSFTLTVPTGARVRTVRASLGLFTTDLNYYQYHASVQEQLDTPVSVFANGPVLFSNIDGGYGVFAAYNATYADLK